MNKKHLAKLLALIVSTNLITFMASEYYYNGTPKSNNEVFKKFDKVFTVRNDLYKYYDGKIDDNVLVEGAVKGMTDALKDPYTVFMNKEETQSFNTQTSGSYAGIGLQVAVKDDVITVVSTFNDSPAKKAGILTGDIIKKIEGTVVEGKDLEKAVSLIKGPENTEVTVTLFRKDKGDFDIKIKREKIKIETVKSEMLNNNIGYVSVEMFDEHTDKDFATKLNELKDKGMKGVIVDLRGNPGGLLNVAQNMLSNFIEKGKVITYTIDKDKKKTEYKSNGGDFTDMPVVILTDGGSASASEIFSGAMRDYKRATLIGDKTFGKGVVQQVFDYPDGTLLKVTVSKYYTPNGENINKTGIKPDVEVQYPEELKTKTYDRAKDPQFAKALEVIKEKVK